MRIFGFMFMTLLLALSGAAPASADTLPAGGAKHLAITLVPETPTPAAGSKLTLALQTVPAEGWHGYWSQPGDAGFSAKLDWTLPKGLTVSEPAYPAPQRLLIAGLMNYVFERPYAPLLTLNVPAGLAPGTRLPIALAMQYLVCTASLCVPEQASLSIVLTVGDGVIDAPSRAKFDSWRQALPQPLGGTATYAVADGKLRIAVPFPASAQASDVYFYPLRAGVLDHAAPQTFTRNGDMLVVETKAVPGLSGEVAGVLQIGARALAVTAQRGNVPGAATGSDGWLVTTVVAFLAAILGGLVLNVMPCVFPILSLKALALARSGDPAHARREGLGYTAGAIAACLALGATILALRAGGSAVGWAFQLQQPRMILALLLLTLAISLNLAGLFNLPVPRFASRSGGGAFATGALAAFVATPCTGPFMGAALGAALVLPWPAALAVFGGLGLGLALPFLILGFVPALQRRLPKPGAWMERLQRILSVPMFLTVAALAWVLWRQAGTTGLIVAGVAGFVVLVLLWAIGRAQAKGRAVWPGALAVLLVGAAAIALVARAPVSAQASADAFSEARLAALQAQGRPVFAYFTADWCLTCKVNEATAIAPARADMERNKVAVLMGDWTDGDPVLGRFIQAHGRAGVPLYLYYRPGAAQPEVLPQVLTPSMLEKLGN